MALLGLTPATARRVAAKLDEADARGPSFAETVARPTAWVRVTGEALEDTDLDSDDPVYPGVVCQMLRDGTWQEFGACRLIAVAGEPAEDDRVPAWQTGNHTDGTPQFYSGGAGGLPGDLVCVRVMTWVHCETGGLVRTFKWLTLPAAWVFDTAQTGCPTSGTP